MINLQQYIVETYLKYLTEKTEDSDKEQQHKKQLTLRKYQEVLKKFFADSTQFNDVLLYHTVGTGKTATSINIFSAINETLGDNYNLILLVKKSLYNNPWVMELRSWLGENKITTINFVFYDTVDADKELIDAITRNKQHGKGNFFVIDEAHNFVRGVINQMNVVKQNEDGKIAKRSQFVKMYNIIQQQKSRTLGSTKIVLLSATPIIQDSFETAVLFNLFEPGLFPSDKKEFNELYVDKEKLELNELSEVAYMHNIRDKVSYVHIDSEEFYARKAMKEIVTPLDAHHEQILGRYSIYGVGNRRWQNCIFPQFSGFSMNYYFPSKEEKSKGSGQVQIKKMEVGEIKQGIIDYYLAQQNISEVRAWLIHNVLPLQQKNLGQVSDAEMDVLCQEGIRKNKMLRALHKHSAKYYRLCMEILSRKGTHIVYSTAVTTAGIFAIKIYFMLLGIQELSVGELAKGDINHRATDTIINTGGANKSNNIINSALVNTFAVFRQETRQKENELEKSLGFLRQARKSSHISNSVGKTRSVRSQSVRGGAINVEDQEQFDKRFRYIEFSGQTGQEERDKLLQEFNRPANLNGDFIKVVLISEVGSEGINLKNVRNLHIVEPLANESEMTQVMGRGIRQGSHKDLPIEQRIVNISVYFNQLSKEALKDKRMRNIDEEVNAEQKRKAKVVSSFLRALKSASIDCHVNIRPDADYQCFRLPIQFYTEINPAKIARGAEKVIQFQKFVKRRMKAHTVKGMYLKAYEKIQEMATERYPKGEITQFTRGQIQDFWYQQEIQQFFDYEYAYLVGISKKKNEIPLIMNYEGERVYIVEKISNLGAHASS